MPRNVKVFIGPSTASFTKRSTFKIVHLMIQVSGGRMTIAALPLAEENLGTTTLTFSCLGGVQPPFNIQLGGSGQIKHVLHLRHMGDLDPRDDRKSLLHRVNGVSINRGYARAVR
jgi:hypothetical protein